MRKNTEKKMEKKKEGKNIERIVKIGFTVAFAVVMIAEPAVVTQAAEASAVPGLTEKFDVLKMLVSSIISSIGMIVTLWGISEWGIAFQGSEGTMQAQAFKRIGGGLVMTFAPQILAVLV